MKNRLAIFSLLAVMLVLLCESGQAQTMRFISRSNGLMSNSVFDILPDREGTLWIGTSTGLFVCIGNSVSYPVFVNDFSFKGYSVNELVDADGYIWAKTSYGLKYWNKADAQLKEYSGFTGSFSLRSSADSLLLVLDRNNLLHYFDNKSESFLPVSFADSIVTDPVDFGLADNYVWIAGEDGVYRYKRTADSGTLAFGPQQCIAKCGIRKAFGDDYGFYYIGEDGTIGRVEIHSGQVSHIIDISPLIQERGEVTDILEMNGSLYVSFATKGVIEISKNEEGRWRIADIFVGAGVCSLKKDYNQDYLYMATEGLGVACYRKSEYRFEEFRLSDFGIKNLVKSIFKDSDGHLWIGTKGSGLLEVYDENVGGESFLHTKKDPALRSDVVNAFAASSHGGFWIATDAGLSFYDYGKKVITSVKGGQNLIKASCILEVNDSSLWVCSAGDGVSSVRVSSDDGALAVNIRKKYRLGSYESSNLFYCVCQDTIGALWFANKGFGLYEVEEDYLHQIFLEKHSASAPVNDVVSIAQAGGNLYLGTGAGLVSINGEGVQTFYGENQGLLNTSVHSLTPEMGGEAIWISTNDGLWRYCVERNSFEHFGEYEGLSILEYSDCAAFNDGEAIYFGGPEGWVKISGNKNVAPSARYVPSIYFTYLKVGDSLRNAYASFINNSNRITLSPSDNNVTLQFAISDNVSFPDYDFYYSSSGNDGSDWVKLISPQIVFNDFNHRRYRLCVKAVNRVTGVEAYSDVVRIVKKQHWYASGYFLLASLLIFILLCTYIVKERFMRIKLLNKEKLATMERQHKDELYEEKLKFFTNITHEFRTPLTLAYVPCEQLLSYRGSDFFVRRNASQIKYNIELINKFVQEIIDFRRLETNHQKLKVSRVNLSDLCSRIADNFSTLADANFVEMERKITEDMQWTVDGKLFARIVTNLLSNAFKYTPSQTVRKVTFRTS